MCPAAASSVESSACLAARLPGCPLPLPTRLDQLLLPPSSATMLLLCCRGVCGHCLPEPEERGYREHLLHHPPARWVDFD